jgi:HSP20 family protein
MVGQNGPFTTLKSAAFLVERCMERRSTMLSNLAHRLGTQFTDPFATLYRGMASEDFSDGQAAPLRSGFGCLSLWEDGDYIYLDMDVPGLTIEEIELVVEGGKLWIRGARRPIPRGQKCWRDERFYGNLERVLVLGDSVDTDKIEAALTNGVLSIALPKKSEAKAQRIPIQSNSLRISHTG